MTLLLVAVSALIPGAAFAGPDGGRPTAKWCIDLDPNVAAVVPTATHAVVAFVTRGNFDSAGDAADNRAAADNDCGGSALDAVAVSFTLTDDDPDGALVPDTNGTENTEVTYTDAAGQTTLYLSNKTGAEGVNTLAATPRDAGSVTGHTTIDITWDAPRPPPMVTIEVTIDINGAPLRRSSLAVPEGADGIDILDRAVQAGFIGSYQTTPGWNGHYLRCIDDICAEDIQTEWPHVYTAWLVCENDSACSYSSLNGLSAQEADRFHFLYSGPWTGI